jgi:hypothetical protein
MTDWMPVLIVALVVCTTVYAVGPETPSTKKSPQCQAVRLGRVINRDYSANRWPPKRRNMLSLPEAQAAFCRRRHQPRRPPPAKIRPGRPAPAMRPGTRSCRHRGLCVAAITFSADLLPSNRSSRFWRVQSARAPQSPSYSLRSFAFELRSVPHRLLPIFGG